MPNDSSLQKTETIRNRILEELLKIIGVLIPVLLFVWGISTERGETIAELKGRLQTHSERLAGIERQIMKQQEIRIKMSELDSDIKHLDRTMERVTNIIIDLLETKCSKK